ncbi:hypothetical protein A2U01_0102985, partial [Trifolium medium]|nr:hypothetical protein [Trifolium medium]
MKSLAGCPGVSLWRPAAEPPAASSFGFFLELTSSRSPSRPLFLMISIEGAGETCPEGVPEGI